MLSSMSLVSSSPNLSSSSWLARHSLLLLLNLLVCSGEWLLMLCTFVGPWLMLVLVLSTNAYLLYKPIIASMPGMQNYKAKLRKAVLEICDFWRLHGQLFHQYSVRNLDRIPQNGGALLVFYHGPVPLDFILLISTTLLERNRLMHSVVDRQMVKMLGFEMIAACFGCFGGGREEVVKRLKEGQLVGVAPGGGLEAQCASNQYEVLWNKRRGFAEVAFKADVPIIPVFTENIRECVINVQSGLSWWRRLYFLTKLPLTPLYGFFPVRLTTHIGFPILPKDFENVEQLRLAVIDQMEALIKEHQTLPGDLVTAVAQRLNVDTREAIANDINDDDNVKENNKGDSDDNDSVVAKTQEEGYESATEE